MASSVDTSLGDQPTDHNNVEHSVHAENCLPEDETLSEHQSWTTSITEWPLAKETSWQTSEERNQISYSVEEDQSSPQKTVTSSFENKMSEPFLVINYNRSPGVAQDVRIDPNIPPNDYILEGSSSREPLLFTGQLEKLNPLKQSDIVRDFRDENMHIPHLSPHEQRPAQTQLPSRTVSPFVTDMNSQPLRDSTNRVSEQLERMPSFPGHDYVRNDGPRQAALPYFWERTRGKLLERPSNPRLIRKSVIPTSRTAGAFGAQRAQRSSITPSKTCGPGYLTVGSKPWTVRQNPSPLKDRIGLFKALSRNESEAQLPDRPKQAKSSIGRQTAGKVMEALRIFSLSKDKRQHGSSAGNVPKPADTLSPRIWGTSRLFRSDTSTSVAGTFSLAALSSSSKARFGHTRATSKSESPGEDGTPMRRFLHATLDEDADSVTTSHTRPIGTPQMTISNDCASPTDPAPRTARRRGIACNEMPQVYKAQCPLEQPKPVRGSDMRRLVSLCRDKVSKHMFWGESEGGKG